MPDITGTADMFWKRIIADVNKANIVVFAVIAACGRLVAVLEPMRADNVGVAKRTLHEIGVKFTAVGLAKRFSNG